MSHTEPELVAGIDSSTQSATVVIRNAETGALRRFGSAPHPPGTEVDPHAWLDALQQAIAMAGGLEDVSAVSIGGQQHGMVCLDDDGQVVRPALLWNDTRSAQAATDLIAELGDGDPEAGSAAWARRVGLVPVASFTVTKLRWLAEHEPENAARVAAVALPHDWLTWRLAGDGPGSGIQGLHRLTTDASDASGTGYFDAVSGSYDMDLLARAFGRELMVPQVVAPGQVARRVPAAERGSDRDLIIGPGAGDNAAAALGLGLDVGDVAISIGTSGVVSAVSDQPTVDPSGIVASFADATGHYLPLACTLNGSQVFDAVGSLLGVEHKEFAELAISAPAGSDGLTLVPYFEGERTPNLPDATGAIHGIRRANLTPAHLARAAVEGILSGLADALGALRQHGLESRRVLLIGGAARSKAVQQLAPEVLGQTVEVPKPGEYVADGAARQAAWALYGANTPPEWGLGGVEELDVPTQRDDSLTDRYARAREMTFGA